MTKKKYYEENLIETKNKISDYVVDEKNENKINELNTDLTLNQNIYHNKIKFFYKNIRKRNFYAMSSRPSCPVSLDIQKFDKKEPKILKTL